MGCTPGAPALTERRRMTRQFSVQIETKHRTPHHPSTYNIQHFNRIIKNHQPKQGFPTSMCMRATCYTGRYRDTPFAFDRYFIILLDRPDKTPNISGDVKTPNISGDVKTPNISGDDKTPNISGDVKTPNISGDVKTYNISGDDKTPDISGDVKTYNISGDDKTPNISGDVKTPNTVHLCGEAKFF
ncbi:hypothetical protein M8J77_020681 [Diaphorina citri]|nr:hypothetical protein M8J77_020681 [Diaphorina citri]